MTYDLLIRNGRVIDGSGMPSYNGDVAISDGRIAQTGRLGGAARRTIDAHGQVIAPGFIDNHCHFDAQVTWDPLCSFSCYHGVTTVVFGNCSLAMAPAGAGEEERYFLTQLLARVEAIPLEALQAGMSWSWGTIGEYLDALDRRLGVNAGVLIGHSAVRRYVMGEASQERDATAKELEAMKEVVQGGMASGALGISFNRNQGHFDDRGRLIPGVVAPMEEMFELASVLRGAGTGIVQFGNGSLFELRERICTKLSQVSGRPVIYATITPFGDDLHLWRKLLDVVEETVKQGNRAFPDICPRPLGGRWTMANSQVFDTLPTWKPIMVGPPEEKLRAFQDPEVRKQLHPEAVEGGVAPDAFFDRRWDLINVIRPALEKNADLKGKSVAQIAEERGADVLDAFLDLVVEEGLKTQFETSPMGSDEQAMSTLLNSPYTVVGLADSGAHLIFDPGYGFCTHFLRYWVGDKGIMSLEAGVRKLTFDQASLFGMYDRGLIWPGMAADLVIFDPDAIGLREMEEVYDLPGGGPRLKQVADGIECTVVNGEVLIEKGEHTGAYPGRVMRNSSYRTPAMR